MKSYGDTYDNWRDPGSACSTSVFAKATPEKVMEFDADVVSIEYPKLKILASDFDVGIL